MTEGRAEKYKVTWVEVLRNFERKINKNLNCHRVGVIQEFNSSKQTAQILLVEEKRVIDDLTDGTLEIEAPPLLVDVPVFFWGGSNTYITVPVKKGDSCLVMFSDKDTDNWYETGEVTIPNSDRMHDLSDGFALVGFRSQADVISSFESEKIAIKYNDGKITVGDKIAISNSSDNIKDILDSLIDAIAGLTTLDSRGDTGIVSVVSQTTINAIKTRINNLLE